jgi:formate hydrogenlyase subunit 4
MKIISILMILVSALFFPGIISMLKSKVVGRKMPSILQPLFDVIRLFKKGSVYSNTSGFIFRIAPLVYFASVFSTLFFLPVAGEKGLISFDNDLVFFAYLLGIGKFMMIIAAMDTGSGFEGMGANREALYSLLVEPAFFILMGSLALFTNHTSFYDLFVSLQINTNLSYIIGFAGFYVLLFIAMIENSRLPVDDPKTHLELTMVHEVMVLDYSGFDLGLIHITTWLKFAIYGSLISNFLINFSWPLGWRLGAFFGIQFICAVVIGLLESFRARNKMDKNPQWILMISAIAMVAFLAMLIISQKIVLN